MEILLGSIHLVPYDFVPAGYLACDGSVLPINEHSALFAVLGTTFSPKSGGGGDGVKTFSLPKIKAPTDGTHWVICVDGAFPMRP